MGNATPSCASNKIGTYNPQKDFDRFIFIADRGHIDYSAIFNFIYFTADITKYIKFYWNQCISVKTDYALFETRMKCLEVLLRTIKICLNIIEDRNLSLYEVQSQMTTGPCSGKSPKNPKSLNIYTNLNVLYRKMEKDISKHQIKHQILSSNLESFFLDNRDMSERNHPSLTGSPNRSSSSPNRRSSIDQIDKLNISELKIDYNINNVLSRVENLSVEEFPFYLFISGIFYTVYRGEEFSLFIHEYFQEYLINIMSDREQFLKLFQQILLSFGGNLLQILIETMKKFIFSEINNIPHFEGVDWGQLSQGLLNDLEELSSPQYIQSEQYRENNVDSNQYLTIYILLPFLSKTLQIDSTLFIPLLQVLFVTATNSSQHLDPYSTEITSYLFRQYETYDHQIFMRISNLLTEVKIEHVVESHDLLLNCLKTNLSSTFSYISGILHTPQKIERPKPQVKPKNTIKTVPMEIQTDPIEPMVIEKIIEKTPEIIYRQAPVINDTPVTRVLREVATPAPIEEEKKKPIISYLDIYEGISSSKLKRALAILNRPYSYDSRKFRQTDVLVEKTNIHAKTVIRDYDLEKMEPYLKIDEDRCDLTNVDLLICEMEDVFSQSVG